MPFELKVLAEPGSATECGECPGSARAPNEAPICVFCGREELTWIGASYVRLPECIAAEKAQGGGGV